ncbi:hypothetical protein DM2_882 [Halorubrum sp. DM2]|nr:hypothetical protein DM2_882 [Halorubrum sp. DM2]
MARACERPPPAAASRERPPVSPIAGGFAAGDSVARGSRWLPERSGGCQRRGWGGVRCGAARCGAGLEGAGARRAEAK